MGTILGGFECSYNRRSSFIYRCSQKIKAYFIRKNNWKEFEEMFPEFYQEMRRTLLHSFYTSVVPLMKTQKKLMIEKFEARADFKQIFVMKDFNEVDLEQLILEEHTRKNVRDRLSVKKSKDDSQSPPKNKNNTFEMMAMVKMRRL